MVLLKKGVKLDEEEKALIAQRGFEIASKRSPGKGRPKGSGARQRESVAQALGSAEVDLSSARVLETGRMAVMEKLAQETGLRACLVEALGQDDADAVLAQAAFQVCEGEAAYLTSEWLDEVQMAHPPAGDMSSAGLHRLEKELGGAEGRRLGFLRAWIKACKTPRALICDGTSHSTRASELDAAEWGHNRDKEKIPQVNVVMVMARETRLPLFFRIMPGSVPDVVTLKVTAEFLKALDMKDFMLTLDRGYYSSANLAELRRDKLGFTVGVPLSNRQAKELYAEHRKGLDSPARSFLHDGEVLRHQSCEYLIDDESLNNDERKITAHFFFSPERHQERGQHLERRLLELEVQAGRQHFKNQPAAERWIEENGGSCKSLLEIKADEAKGDDAAASWRIVRKAKAVARALNQYGVTLIATSDASLPPAEVLEDYRSRDPVEKLFDTGKNFLPGRRLRVHSDPVLQGRLFVNFIALILAAAFENKLKDAQLKAGLSLREALARLRKCRVMHIPGRDPIALEIPKKSREILAAFGLT
jgi:transposase